MPDSCWGRRTQEESKSVGLTSPLSILLSLQGCEWVASLVISSFRHSLLFSDQRGSKSDDRERDHLWGKATRWPALCQRPPPDKAPICSSGYSGLLWENTGLLDSLLSLSLHLSPLSCLSQRSPCWFNRFFAVCIEVVWRKELLWGNHSIRPYHSSSISCCWCSEVQV